MSTFGRLLVFLQLFVRTAAASGAENTAESVAAGMYSSIVRCTGWHGNRSKLELMACASIAWLSGLIKYAEPADFGPEVASSAAASATTVSRPVAAPVTKVQEAAAASWGVSSPRRPLRVEALSAGTGSPLVAHSPSKSTSNTFTPLFAPPADPESFLKQAPPSTAVTAPATNQQMWRWGKRGFTTHRSRGGGA